MAFSTGVWNLRALNSGRPGSLRIGMRKKSRRSRSPPKCAAETPPAEAETKNNTSPPADLCTQKPESPRRPKKTANGFSIHAATPPSRRQARAAACAEAPQALAEGAVASKQLPSPCRTPSPRSVPTRMFRMSRMRARCRLVPTPCRIGCQFSGSATSSCPLRSVKGTFPLPFVVPANQH